MSERDSTGEAVLRPIADARGDGDPIQAHVSETATATPTLTNADFALLASRMAQTASHWAADTLILPELRGEQMRASSLRRFLSDMRQSLNWMEERANGKQ